MPRARVANHLALRWLGKDGAVRDFTYAICAIADQPLRQRARRRSACRQGERVFVLAGRIPELYVAVLGALKNRCVVCPLFSAFGPEPIHTRLALGDGTRAGDDRKPVPEESRGIARAAAATEARAARARRRRPDQRAGHARLSHA